MNLYWESFKTFFKIGIFTLGGGYAMIPLIEEEVVNKHKWVEKDEMLDLIAIAQSCPGVFAINIAIFIGYKLKKVRGAIATTLGTALPSFMIILAIAIFHLPRHPSCRRSTDCRTYVSSGTACETELVHLLDPHRRSPCHLEIRILTYLRHHHSRYRRLCLWKDRSRERQS